MPNNNATSSSKKENKEIWKDANFYKLIIMLVMVVLYFFAELIVGIISGSLALIADAFHMLSDAISLVIGTVGVVVGHKKHNVHYTFGYARAEIIGGLVNAIFLLSVVMFIVLDAIERFFEPKRIDNPILVLCVAGGGFLINVIGMIMFCGHHHGHDHGHDHGSHSHEEKEHEHERSHSKENHKHQHDHHHDESEHAHAHEKHHDDLEMQESEHHHHHEHSKKAGGHSHHNENIFGVLLHVFGDLLGSVGVMIASATILACRYFVGESSDKYTVYIDPIISLVIAGILFFPTLPLVRRCIKVLMQSVPDSVSVGTLRKELEAIPGVTSLHELHVWSLIRNERNIGSVHINVLSGTEHKPVVRQAKAVFHKFGIHSVTVQLEDESETNTQCAFVCPEDCHEKMCCEPETKPLMQSTD